MVKYSSSKQISFAEFRTPFEKGIDGSNRWVRLAVQIPWDELSRIYCKSLRDDFGRPAVDARVVIGAMIIKHKKSLSDEDTIEEIHICNFFWVSKNSATDAYLTHHCL